MLGCRISIMTFSTTKRRLPTVLLAALALSGAASAQTTAVSSLLPPFVAGDDIISMGNWRANQFTTGSNLIGYDLYSATLQMSVANLNLGNFFVGIYSNSNNILTGDKPGAQMGANLDGSSSPGAAGQYTYLASSIHLDPNTSYWLVEGVTPISFSGYFSDYEIVNPSVTNTWTLTGQSSFSTSNGLSWLGPVTGSISMMSLQMVDVPEPAECGLIAGVVGLAGCVVVRRRKNKARATVN